MIRPIGISNPVKFKGYNDLGDEDKKIYSKEKKDKFGLTKSEKNIFLAGAFIGAIMGIGGTTLIDKTQIRSMMKNMQSELKEGGIDSLRVEDVTDDKVSDIILVGNDGVSTIYDINTNKIYYEMNGDRVEIDH